MNKRHFSRNTIALLALFVLFSTLRVILGCFIGAWFPGNEYWDDALLARYSEIVGYFKFHSPTGMVKYLAYPVFLCVVGVSHIPITIWLSGMWLTAGYLGFCVSRKLGLSARVSFVVFLYISYIPEAFESWCGTRLYRNSIIGPCAAISLLLMIRLFYALFEDEKGNCIVRAVFTGLATAFTYYIKEDGIWILACLLFATLVYALGILFKRPKQSVAGILKKAVVAILPLVILFLISVGYKTLDYKFFGVYGTNTRTGGASGEFMSLVYFIDSPNRTAELWAPYDAIKNAFDASETLSSHPEFLESIENSIWLPGSIFQSPIYGDFLGWVIYSSGIESGIWADNAGKEAFFRQVNAELKQAFSDGRLQKIQGRITLLPSAGSRTWSEVLNLKRQIVAGYKGAIFYEGYNFGIETYFAPTSADEEYVNALMIDRTHLNYLSDYSLVSARSEKASKVAGVMSYVYIIMNLLFILAFVANIPLGVYSFVKKKKSKLSNEACTPKAFLYWCMSVVFAGIGFVYVFSIAWFSSFIHGNGIVMSFINYYNVALPVLLALAFMFALACWNRLTADLSH